MLRWIAILLATLALLTACGEEEKPTQAQAPTGAAEQPISERTAEQPAEKAVDPMAENTLVITLDSGDVHILLNTEKAPKHAERMKELARSGFYDGIIFHRVIDGFMAQTGDPLGTGTGGSDMPNLPAEFSDLPFERGTLGMARSRHPDSANSQFFICFKPARFLDGEYTVVGQVTQGMELVDGITRGEPPANPDKMLKVRVLADI